MLLLHLELNYLKYFRLLVCVLSFNIILIFWFYYFLDLWTPLMDFFKGMTVSEH